MCGFFSEDEEQDQSKKKPVKKKAEDDMRIPGPEDLGLSQKQQTLGRVKTSLANVASTLPPSDDTMP